MHRALELQTNPVAMQKTAIHAATLLLRQFTPPQYPAKISIEKPTSGNSHAIAKSVLRV